MGETLKHINCEEKTENRLCLKTRTLTAALTISQLMKTFIIALVVGAYPHMIYTHTYTFEQKMTNDKSC